MHNYEVYYNSYLLDEIHNYFPAILYEPSIFHSVTDLMNYIQYQMRMRFDLFSAAQRTYQPSQYSWGSRPRWPPAGPQAAAVPPPRYIPPMTPVTTRDNTVDELTVTMETMGGLGSLGGLLGLGGGGGGDAADATTLLNQLFRMPLTRSPPADMEPVVVRPTAAEIDAGTTIEILDAEEEICAICQDTMEAGSQARNINACDHRFHVTCIDTWFQRNVRCPVCRYDVRVPVPPENEEDGIDSE